MEQKPQKRIMGTFKLAMINVAAIISITNLPIMSITGGPLIAYFILAALFFFLPMSFIAAELATGWPLRGGFYSWTKLAMGSHMGFLAIWLQWIANIVWYPTIMAPAVASIAYLIDPNMPTYIQPWYKPSYSLPWFMFIGMNAIYWGITLLNARGMKESSTLSAIGVISGSIIPGLIIIAFGVIWILTGHHSAIQLQAKDMLPPLNNISNLILLTGLITTLTGMEMSAVHVNDVTHPQKDYPRSIFLAIFIIMGISILAALALAILMPADKINLVSGMMQGVELFCNAFGFGWFAIFLGVFMAIGTLTMASTWIGGPAKGIQVAASDGDIPAYFNKLNKKEMPIRVMIIEGILFSLTTLLFLILPSVMDSFWALIALTSQLYMLMYFILFLVGIVMRYRYPLVYRSYRIKGKYNLGMWITGGAGIIGAIAAFLLTLVPPDGFQAQSATHYVLFLLTACGTITFLPFVVFCIIHHKRKDDPSQHREMVLVNHASHVPVREITET